MTALLAMFLGLPPAVDLRLPKFPRTVIGGALDRRIRSHTGELATWIRREAAASDAGQRYELAVSTDVRQLDLGRGSVVLTQYTYLGGAHGMTTFRTFNVRAGKDGTVRDVALRDLFTTPDYRPVVETALLTKLRDVEGAAWVESGEKREFAGEELRAFTVERDGSLRFHFEPYLLGPYSSGPFVITLSKTELGPTYRGG